MGQYSSHKSPEYAPAKRSLGQNFLSDDRVIHKIIGALGDPSGKNCVEIGPGRGALTRPLVTSGADLTVIELDDELAAKLSREFADTPQFRCINANILDIDISTISDSETVIVGNLPYYISTAIIRHLITSRGSFKRLVLMVQKEVADRVVAPAGNSERGFLTVLVEQFLNVKREFDVGPDAFSPQPKVWSSVISLEPRMSSIKNESAFEKLVSIAFAQKRKTILNNLKGHRDDAALKLSEASIEGKRRAESLTHEEWLRLFEVWQK